MHNVMRGLCAVVICSAGRWLPVTAEGMVYPLPSRLIQSAYHSLVTAGSYHVRVRLVTDFFGTPLVSFNSIDIGLRPMRERAEGGLRGTVQLGGRLVHIRSHEIRLVVGRVEVDQKANGAFAGCVLITGPSLLPSWVYGIFIQYRRTVHRSYAVTLGPESIHGIPVWHVRQGLRETRPRGHTSVHSVNYDVDLYVSRVTGRLVRELWRMTGHVQRMSAVADYSAYGKRVVVKLPPRATRPGECRDSPPADRGAAEEGRAARIQGQL